MAHNNSRTFSLYAPFYTAINLPLVEYAPMPARRLPQDLIQVEEPESESGEESESDYYGPSVSGDQEMTEMPEDEDDMQREIADEKTIDLAEKLFWTRNRFGRK
jgi:hypothetical protein